MNQPQNMSMLFPMPLPMVQQQADLQEPTARVKVAITYLRDCMVKRMDRAAVNDISIEIIPGQELVEMEKRAQAAAAELLVSYFKGALIPDRWEQEGLANTRHARKPPKVNDMANGTIINCFACAGGPVRSNCKFCRGTGTVLVFPSCEGER